MVEISLMRDDSYVSSFPELNIINLNIQGSNFWGESSIVEREPISRRQYISDLVYMITRALSWEALLRIIYLLEDWDTAYELDSMLNDDPELYYRFIELTDYHLFGDKNPQYVDTHAIIPEWLQGENMQNPLLKE